MTPATHIPKDPALPQLAMVLNTKHMARAIENGLSASDMCPNARAASQFRVHQCQIERVKYKPGRNCLVCYRLEVQDMNTGQFFHQRLTGRIYEDGGSYSRFTRAMQHSTFTSALGAAVIHIPPLHMVAWLFPNERKLGSLPALLDQRRLKQEFLPPVIRARWENQWGLNSFEHEIVHYVPEHSCTVRVDMRLTHAASREIKPWTVFAKSYYNRAGELSFRHMRQLWQCKERIQGAFGMPQPLYYEPKHRVLWQEGVNGQTFLDVTAGHTGHTDVTVRAAAAIAGLHQTQVDCPTKIETEHLVGLLRDRRALLIKARNSFAAPLTALTERLAFQASTLNGAPTATLHGDLHPKNILVDDGNIYLIDLDNVAKGPPLYDVGSWIADRIYRAFLSARHFAEVQPDIAGFVEEYRARVPWTVTAKELNWFTAVALLNERAFRCLTRLKMGRLEILGELIQFADRISLDPDALRCGP